MPNGSLLPLLFLLLILLPSLLAWRHVLKHDQPRVWLLLFCCMPIGGPLLYWLWPTGGRSRPRR